MFDRPKTGPAISVIVPTIGRVQTLSRCLECLAKMEEEPRAPWEVLVMDTGLEEDKEATRNVVQEFHREIHDLRYFPLPPLGLMLGRHRAVAESRGKVLAFLDDDSFASPTWLRAIDMAFQERDVAMVGGPNLPEYAAEPPGWLDYFWTTHPRGRYLGDLSLQEFGGERSEISPWWIWGCNLSIRKDILLRVGGFHPDGVPPGLMRYRGDGETALGIKVTATGLKSVFHPLARIRHFVPADRMTPEYFRRRGFRQGVSDSFTDIRRKHGLGAGAGVPALPQEGSMARGGKVIRYCRKAVEYVGSVVGNARRERNDSQRMYRRVIQERNRGYREGYRFHQGEARKDPCLRQWVLLEAFLGAEGNLPLPDTANKSASV